MFFLNISKEFYKFSLELSTTSFYHQVSMIKMEWLRYWRDFPFPFPPEETEFEEWAQVCEFSFSDLWTPFKDSLCILSSFLTATKPCRDEKTDM